MTEQLPSPRKRFVFDPTINLGHILTMVTFLFAAFIAFRTVDVRVVVLEEARAAQTMRDQAQDARMTELLSTLKEGAVDVRRSVERLSDKIDRKNESK